MPDNLTLLNLFYFMPLNEQEKNFFNFDKNIKNRFISDLDNDIFYLGGQLKMRHNDFINSEIIQKVKEINEKRNREYGGPCNSWEAASMYTSQKELEYIENMIKTYNLIMKLREKEKLNESNPSYNI